jgi:hypothetical protein
VTAVWEPHAYAVDAEDVKRYRYAAKWHSAPALRAAASCKALAWSGKRPTVVKVAKLASVGFELAQLTVDQWHGRRGVPMEDGSELTAYEPPYRNVAPGYIHVSSRAIEAAADLTTMCLGPLHPNRKRRRKR